MTIRTPSKTKKMKFTIIFIAALALHAASAFSQHNTEPDGRSVALLNKYSSDYVKSFLEGKPGLLTPYYSEKIRVMPELQKTLTGKTNVAQYYVAFLKRFEVKAFKRDKIEILDLGGQVMEIGRIAMTIVLKSTSTEYLLKGAYLNLWEQLPDGQLLLLTEAWNYDEYYGEIHEHLKFAELAGIHIALQPNVNIDSNISFELAALNRMLDETVTNHDANAWSWFYADDAILIPNYHAPYMGKKEITGYIEMHVKELPVFEELDIRHERIDPLGDFVVEYGSHIASWRDGTSSGVGLGKNIRVWRREPDHSLKLFRSIAMYD
jgi:ketosteroid isomerase-like protein